MRTGTDPSIVRTKRTNEIMNDDPQLRFEWRDDESPSQAIARAVAAVEGVSQTELPPLYETIEPDALDAFFDVPQSTSDAERRVSFSYLNYEIDVHQRGEIVLTEAPNSRRRTGPDRGTC